MNDPLVADEKESHCCIIKLFLDPSFQQTFVSQKIMNELKIKHLREINMGVRDFQTTMMEIRNSEYEIKVLSINSN